MILTFGLAILTGILVHFFLIPYMRKKILREAEAVQKADRNNSILKSCPGTGKSSHVVYTAGPTMDDDGEVAVVTEQKKENGNCNVLEEHFEGMGSFYTCSSGQCPSPPTDPYPTQSSS